MSARDRSFRSLLEGGEIVLAPGAADAVTARLVEAAGFPAVYMTGFGATAGRLGMPDIGLLSQTEMTEHARNMTRAVSIPVIADADTGYGGPSNIDRTVREYVQAGVAAIHLEDQAMPKRCGQRGGVRLVDADSGVKRVRCAVEARGSADLLVIGRTDALPVEGVAEAVRRARLYQDAGADLVFVDGIRRIKDLEAVAAAVDGPKVVSIVDGNETTALTASDLQELGFSVAFYALTALFTATRAVADALAHLRAAGTPAGGPPQHSYEEFSRIVGMDVHQDLDERFGD
ncbi:isocitrate lyase/PEP mutase family protein [Streptomyces showdoensis]|uniref:2,3-dimethylmalate lyase n=1 Tax=Streptomyces showdoensis TaxID=68268 RepID=A0A2P2GNQ4_STREW|nr:isocitrate lyase/PEP mutase family protein [Streptomyces showdoensis]KKZ73131.1 2,3-dimethylmalate lyase [Streptomyces showdoensis]